MKRVVTWTCISILVGIIGPFFGVPLLCRVFGPPALGSGSYKYAKLWRDKLAACHSLDDARQHFNCGRYQANPGGSHTLIRDPNTYKDGNTWALLYDFPNGDWLAMAYANSHNTWGGGTVVTRDNTGRTRVFFGHVCGEPSAYGQSLKEVYAHLEDPAWKEISLDKLVEPRN